MNDLISRQDALNQIMKKRWALQMMDDTHTADKIMDGLRRAEIVINELPSAQPERKKGKWMGKPIAGYSTVRCSVCGDAFLENSGKWNFCPNCGADIRGGTE